MEGAGALTLFNCCIVYFFTVNVHRSAIKISIEYMFIKFMPLQEPEHQIKVVWRIFVWWDPFDIYFNILAACQLLFWYKFHKVFSNFASGIFCYTTSLDYLISTDRYQQWRAMSFCLWNTASHNISMLLWKNISYFVMWDETKIC